MSLFSELRRRNVLRVGAAYIVTAWLLIQVAETIFPLFGFGDAPARMVVIVLAIGFIPALIVSWAFELTPEGFKRESRVEDGLPAAPHAHKSLDRLIMVVLALALGYFAFDKFVLEPERDEARERQVAEQARTDALIGSYGQNSLAVLPFVNMSGDAENEYFSDGIAEEVLNLLAKIPDLRVISRSSSFSYRGKDIDIPSIAEQLNVALILEGSVRRYGDRVRITAQLIEARSDTHLWSETYERRLEDVFAIQDELSAAIVESLRNTINLEIDEAPSPTAIVNKEAHDAYLRGNYLLAKREVSAAVREFQKAISFEPEYALAHAQLAIAYQLGYLGISYTEMEVKAAPHVEKAMAFGPSLAESHAASGQLSITRGHTHQALEHFGEALRINPSYADVYTWTANLLDWTLGRYAEAFAMREKAVQLDPLSQTSLWNYIYALKARDRVAEAAQAMEKLASLAPAQHGLLRAEELWMEGNWAAGMLGLLEALQADPGIQDYKTPALELAYLGLEREVSAVANKPGPYHLSILGKPRQAVAAAQARLAEDPLRLINHGEVGLMLAGAGDYAAARPYLEAAWQRYGAVVVGPRFNINHATALIMARRAAGEVENVDDLVEAIRDNVRRYAEAGISIGGLYGWPAYEEGLADFLAGDEQRGIELIGRAVEEGYFILPNVGYLGDLYAHPGFAAIRSMQESRQARERDKVLAVVCTDNPYADVWQPAEETCEGVG